MIKNLIKFGHQLIPQKTMSATITSSIQLVTTKTTYEIFLKIIEAKAWKNKLLQTTD